MQRVPSVVNIGKLTLVCIRKPVFVSLTSISLLTDGHDVHTGATVQVMWLGVWYEGKVIKIGPKRNLCRVRIR